MKLTVREAARLLSVSETDLYHLVEEGEIPFVSVNHQPLFNREELLEWATVRRMPLSVALFAEEGRRISLADALKIGGVHVGVGGTDIPSTLRAVVDCLPIDDELERETVLEVMLAREAEASTGIGKGIAIPHVRMPLVFAGHPAAIAVCFLDHQVAFAAIDNMPVTTVFAMMTPTIKSHLQLLSHLSYALHDEDLVAMLQQRADRDAILAKVRLLDESLQARQEPPDT